MNTAFAEKDTDIYPVNTKRYLKLWKADRNFYYKVPILVNQLFRINPVCSTYGLDKSP
jgi:hypothetical protein